MVCAAGRTAIVSADNQRTELSTECGKKARIVPKLAEKPCTGIEGEGWDTTAGRAEVDGILCAGTIAIEVVTGLTRWNSGLIGECGWRTNSRVNFKRSVRRNGAETVAQRT